MSFLLKLNKVFIKIFQFCLCLKHAKLQILHCFFTSLHIISIEAQPFSFLKAWKIDFNCISLNASASDLTHTMGNSTGMIVFPLSHSSFGLCNRKQKYYCKLAVLGVARPDGAGALEFTRRSGRESLVLPCFGNPSAAADCCQGRHQFEVRNIILILRATKIRVSIQSHKTLIKNKINKMCTISITCRRFSSINNWSK